MQKMTIRIKNLGLGLVAGLIVISLIAAPAVSALATQSNTSQAAKLQLIINRGNNEISRRLSKLNGLTAKVNSAAKLTAGDKATLSQAVTDQINSLTGLKTKLDADTDVATARTDAQSIISDYRVYVLVVPKVYLVRTADDQQVAEGKLSDLATKLQSRLASVKAASVLQAALSDMTSKVSTAQGISSSVESSVIGLQPSDYNSNHSTLSGYRDQLKTAQNDLQGAVSDAKTIITGLKTR